MNTNNKQNKVIKLLVGFSLILSSVWAFMRYLAIKLVTRPERNSGSETPAEYGLPFEEIWFNSRDGIRLHGWFIPATQPKATIILGHGHVSSKEPSLAVAQFLWQAGYSSFMFDFRGHGRNEQGGVSISYQERLDVHGAVDYLLGRGEERLGYLGFSMGAAVGIIATGENPHIKAIIADSPFAKLQSSVAAYVRLKQKFVPRWLSLVLARFAVWTVARYYGFAPKMANPITFVDKISPRSIFIINGDQDNLTPVENSYQLYEAAHEPKKLWIQKGLAHCVGFQELGDVYKQNVLDFLAQINWETTTFDTKNFEPVYLS